MAYIVLILIVLSYLVFSKYLKGKSLFIFNLAWAIFVTAISFVFGKIPFFGPNEVVILLLVFIFNLLITRLFITKFKVETPNLMLYSSIVLAPILEESFFRGYLLGNIEGSYINKIVICSLLFSLYHLKNYFLLKRPSLIFQLLYAGIFIGPILAIVQFKTGSIFLPIILHSLNNTLASTTTKLLFPKLMRYKENTGYVS